MTYTKETMSNDDYGFDTGIKCPSCEEATLLTVSGDRRKCPHCGYSEPHDPTTTTKDFTHA